MMAVFTIRFQKISKEHRVFGLLLFFGLIHGLIYTFLVPPWQHYDEPTRFEFAWLVANQPGHFTLNDYNPSMRREVAASMVEHGFFRDMQFRPDLLSTTEPVWIGISQLNDPPLYYSIVSIPLRILKNSDIDLQLYAARLVSLLFYLVVIGTTWLISREIIQDPNPLRWMIPAFIVLLPGFVDLMTSVNNDVAATALFSIFLWRSIVLLKNNISLLNIVTLLITLPLAYLTKNTIYIVLPIGFLVILFALLRGSNRRFLWGLLCAAGAITLLFGFRFDNAAYWYSSDIQAESTRVQTPDTSPIRYALRLVLTRYPSFQSLYQLIPTDNIPSLEGANITIGAWIWASKP
ncbi:MAG: hypothetical protein ACM3PY_02520, partial [Omnitrophica WOR_2 bacterium]